VPEGLVRLRATADIEKAMDVIIRSGRTIGVLR
jgi:hypothetical protein